MNKSALTILLTSAVLFIVLCRSCSADRLREATTRFFLVFSGPFELVHRLSSTALRWCWAQCNHAQARLFAGKDFVRLAGAAVLSACGCLSLAIAALTLAGSFAGMLGSASSWSGHLPYEELLAIDLTLTLMVLGSMLFEALGVSRFAGELALAKSRAARIGWIFGLLLLTGFGLALLCVAGSLRADALLVSDERLGQLEDAALSSSNPATASLVWTAEGAIPPQIAWKVRLLLETAPVLAAMAGILVARHCATAIVLAVMTAVTAGAAAVTGLLWLIAAFAQRLLELIFNLVLALIALASGPEPQHAQADPPSPPPSPGDAPAQQPPPSDSGGPEPDQNPPQATWEPPDDPWSQMPSQSPPSPSSTQAAQPQPGTGSHDPAWNPLQVNTPPH